MALFGGNERVSSHERRYVCTQTLFFTHCALQPRAFPSLGQEVPAKDFSMVGDVHVKVSDAFSKGGGRL